LGKANGTKAPFFVAQFRFFCYLGDMKRREKIVYVLCDDIRSTHNVGSIIRTAEALGVKS